MKKYYRYRLAITVLAVIFAALPGNGAWSQTARTIKIVVPYPPGSGPDILSRLMAEQIGRAQGPTVVVENRPGGGTVIGTEAVARAAPDGNTVLLVANSFVVNPALKRQNYDPSTSFEPICYLAATPIVLVVNGTSPYRTLDDMLTAARARPGELALASGGPASALHIAFEVLKRAAHINMTYVPYPGTAPAINALLGGHVAAVFADYPTVVSQLKSGALRGLVTTSHARVGPLPDVPTLGETGVSKYEADIFYGIVAPAKTPSEMVAQLSAWFGAALEIPEMKPKLAKQGLFPVGKCGAEFGAYMREQADEYSRIIRESGIKAE
ncbi:MAG TPA: tripartite tricarboxylate transporter substrate binding protein [Xanthobacteraceae bacterium]|jgi:tripartite-type tricarboxylate transporter receptor subunit TctC